MASARSDARRADDAVRKADEEASRAELNRLLALPIDGRFAAIARPDLSLTDAHRRALVGSLQQKAAARSSVSVRTASRWAIWRSLLPYRVWSLTATAIGIFAVGTLYLVARSQTPELWVVSAYNRDIAATWQFRGGEFAGDRLEAHRHYPLFRREGDIGVLRMWAPAGGYAETRVPLEWLRAPR